MEVRDELAERPLPHSIEGERAILGATILHNPLINQAMELLQPDDFYVRAHYHIFRAMIALRQRGVIIDLSTIGEELRREGCLEQVGGISFISELTYGLPHFTNIAAYARVVRGKSLLRQLIKTLNKITSEALEEEEAPEVILDHAQQAILALAYEYPEKFMEFKNENFEKLNLAQNRFNSKANSVRNRIFISYSHKDKSWLMKL